MVGLGGRYAGKGAQVLRCCSADSVSRKNRSSRSDASARSSWIGRPARSARSPTVARSGVLTVSAPGSVRSQSIPAAVRTLPSCSGSVVRTRTDGSPCNEAIGPAAMLRPLAMMTMSSTVCSTSESMWLEMSTVLPWSAR